MNQRRLKGNKAPRILGRKRKKRKRGEEGGRPIIYITFK